MITRARLAALLLPLLVLLVPTQAGAGSRPAVCGLLDTQAAYISGGGLSLLQSHCQAAGVGQHPGVPPERDEWAGVAGPLPAPATALALEGPDRRLNNPAADQPPATTQSETAIERCGGTLLAAWNDSGSSPFGSFTGYARSTDGGASWADRGHMPGLTGSDPALASDASCRFYFAAITFMDGCSRIGVIRSDDGGQSWSAPANASPGTDCANFQDKEWIEADRTGGPHSGNLYACWDDRGASAIRVLFSRSRDGGQTFSQPQVIDSFGGGSATGCQVAVGPSGEVALVWTEGQTLGLRSRVSTDGGATFGPTASIALTREIGRYGLCGDSLRPLLNGDIRTFNWPSLAINPKTGSLHVAWNDNRGGDPDIYYSRSLDKGAHWSPPARLNTDAGTVDQFQPALAFTGSGVLRAIWYDRRLDPASNYLIDVFSAASTDEGLSFGPNERITDVSFGVPPINPNFDPFLAPCYMGDYIGIAGGQDAHYMAWGDNRDIVNGRPDPDVFFDVRSAGGRSLAVTRTDDPPPDTCRPGDCSLREAVMAANLSPGSDAITLPPGAYTLGRPGEGEDAAATGDIDIAGDLALRGAGADRTTVDADGIERVFEVLSGVTAEIAGMTVTGGRTSGAPGGPVADGGGILNRGQLAVDRLHVTGNEASGSAFGGGIHNAGTLAIANSAVTGNTAGLSGGGVYNAMTLTVVNSTISGNEALAGKGGGLASASAASLNNVTLSGNRSGPAAPVPAGNLSNADSGDLAIANSIIAAGDPSNCAGPIQSLGHNLDDGDTCGFVAEGDQQGADPLLLPLAHNGGGTPSHALDEASPARDTADPASCETADQRGYLRPSDGDGDGTAVCDAGALEMDSRPLGDADCDLDTDAADALWVLRFVAALQPYTPCLEQAGDTDCDGVIGGQDALVILRRVAGLPAQQRPRCPPVPG